jgi:transposase-like protein
MARVQVITGLERRRRWSDEQKRAIVAESFASSSIIISRRDRKQLCATVQVKRKIIGWKIT